MSSVKLELACLIWPIKSPSNRLVVIKIDGHECVDSLRKAVKLKYSQTLDKVDAVNLVLWKCSIPFENLEERLENVRYDEPGEYKLLPLVPILSKISDHFATVPKQTINILVQIVLDEDDEVLPSKRPRIATQLDPSHPLCNLWSLRNHPNTESFISQCKLGGTHSEDTPSSACWITTMNDEINFLLHYNQVNGLKGVLLRKEYNEAFKAVIKFAESGEGKRLTETASDESQESQNELGVQDSYVNPFLNISGSLPARGGFILLGHPGIGKSLWLVILLILRLHARLPTIYQSTVDYAYIFNDEGVFKFNCGSNGEPDWYELSRQTTLPPTTWALIDSNQDLVGVPLAYYNRLFVVQAASPRHDCFAWRDKASHYAALYIMQPWNITELLQGRTLQRYVFSEEHLVAFFDRFGPLTRSVYVNAPIDVYEDILRSRIGNMGYEDICEMFRQARGLDLSRIEVSHQLTLISAGKYRNIANVTIPTRHIYHLLMENCSDGLTRQAASRLYEIFIRNRTRSAVGYMLDENYHEVLYKGGQWRISSMKGSKPGPKFTHWTFQGEEPDMYLRLGFEGNLITFNTCQLPDSTTYSALPIIEYAQGSHLSLTDGYYRPSSPSAQTMDSFIYEASSKTATIFQATVETRPSVKEGGIEWLQGLGVQKFWFIGVTAPEGTLDFPFPNQWHNGVVPHIPDKYVLVLESLRI